jgi:hypothetical protein
LWWECKPTLAKAQLTPKTEVKSAVADESHSDRRELVARDTVLVGLRFGLVVV